MAGLWHENSTPTSNRCILNIIWKVLVLLSFFLQLTGADVVKDNRRFPSNNDVRAAGKVRRGNANLENGASPVPAYENIQGIPSRSYQYSRLRSDSPVQQERVIVDDENYHRRQQQEQKPISRVDDDVHGKQSRSFNSASALATFIPSASPEAISKPLSLRKRDSLAVSSIQDWKLENFVIFVTVDGTIHARSRDAGEELWAWPTTPLIQSKRHKERNKSKGEPHNPDDDIEWIVEAVGGGQLYWYSHDTGLEKLPLSIKEFVDFAPYEAEGKVYIGEKKTEYYTLDPRNGALLFTSEVGHTDKSCISYALKGLEDEECSKKKIILGKTVYTVKIMNEVELLWTIQYVEWGPGRQDADLGKQYKTSLDHKYFMALHNGDVVVRDLSRLGKKEFLNYKFDSPVVQGFDVVTKTSPLSYRDEVPLVLLPQPTDSTYGSGEEEKCYISYFGDSGYFAMSEQSYPGNTGGAGDALGTGFKRISSKPQWNKMDDEDRKEFLVGVHKVERVEKNDRYIQDMLPPLAIDYNLSQNKIKSSARRISKSISATAYDYEKLRWTSGQLVEVVLGLQLLIGFLYLLHRKTSIGGLIPKKLIAQTINTTGSLTGSKTSEIVDIKKDIPMLQSTSTTNEDSKFVQIDQVQDLPKVIEELAVSKTAERQVTFAEPAADEGVEEAKGEPKKANRKARRGARGGGKKRARRDGSGDKELNDLGANDNPPPNFGEPDVKAVISSPEPLQDREDGVLPGDLVVTDQVLGYGSHGTTAFKGSFEGKDVAVKRMLLSFFDVASHEVALLQESDDHPNVVRYYCKQQRGQFLYIALELCPASLYDVTDRPSLFENIVLHMHPPDVLYQITLGVQHLHSLKIVHRDIKPQNILVTAPKQSLRDPGKITPPRLLISDFGLCKKLEPDQSSFRATTAHAAGTTGWRAPELLVTEEGGPPIISTAEGNTTGSTSDGVVLDTLTNRRATRAIDIFSLGCVFYFVLTKGNHPFGDRYMREANIIHGTQNMSHLDVLGDAGLEAKDLISRMIRRNPKQRPDATTVLMHPFFWSAEKKLNFLLDVSDRFEVEEREPPSPLLQLLEENSSEVLGLDWFKRLDKVFIDNLGKYRKYNGGKMLDLLRALRNKKHHYQDLPANVKASLGDLPGGFLQYFTERFPKLILHTYYVVKESELRYEASFRNVFNPA